MTDLTTIERLRGLVLSAIDLKSLTEWPDALVEDYLNILDNLIMISITLDGIIDKDLDKQIYTIPASKNFESRINELEQKLLVSEFPITYNKIIEDVLKRIYSEPSSTPFDLESLERKIIMGLYDVNPDHGNLSGLGNDDHLQYVLRNQWLQNGFVDKSELSLVWSDAGPRTVTLDSVGVSFRYFHDGVMYTEIGALVTTIDDTAGIHAIYINGEGSMTSLANPSEKQIDSIIVNECIVAFIMWDGADGRLIFEFHGYKMSPGTHHWIHDNIGAVYKEGSTLADFTIDDDGDHNIDAQFSVALGEFYDEDLEVSINALAVGDGMEIWYLDGAVWKWKTQGVAPNAFSVLSDLVGTGRLAYNNAGAQTECTNQYYVLCHVFSTNITADIYDSKGRYIAIQGQNQYATKALARAGAETEINTLVYGTLPLPEIVPIGTVIFQTSTAPAFANDVKATTISTDAGDNYVDWRGSNIKATGGSVADHGALAGLADDDHPQYIKDSEFTAADEVMVGTGVGTFGQVTLAASQFLAKKAAGVATNVTAAEARAILNVADGADVTGANAPQAHAASHTDGTDDVRDSTAALKGLATAAQITALEAATLAQHTEGDDQALGVLGTKNPPINADKVIYRDSAAADALVTSTWTQVKAFLKTYFDGLYAILGVNTNITSMTGLDDDGIPVAKVSGAIETAGLAAATLADHKLIRGDGGVRGIQESTIVVSDSGEMTNPSQPAFSVQQVASQQNIAINSEVTITFDSEIYDRGNNFAGNTFTAPVTGLYQISLLLKLFNVDIAASFYQVRIKTTNRNYDYAFVPKFSSNPSSWDISMSVLADMDATDTCYITFYQSNGSAVTDTSSASFFMGVLIG